MSDYRLTDKNVKDLELVGVTWEEVMDYGVSEVFIQAQSTSPMYGPYLVYDAEEMIISKLDGTEHRRYPRNKGLFIRASDIPKPLSKVVESKNIKDLLEDCLEEITKDIRNIEAHFELLHKKLDNLRMLFRTY